VISSFLLFLISSLVDFAFSGAGVLCVCAFFFAAPTSAAPVPDHLTSTSSRKPLVFTFGSHFSTSHLGFLTFLSCLPISPCPILALVVSPSHSAAPSHRRPSIPTRTHRRRRSSRLMPEAASSSFSGSLQGPISRPNLRSRAPQKHHAHPNGHFPCTPTSAPRFRLRVAHNLLFLLFRSLLGYTG
jgi:hypothetical protein